MPDGSPKASIWRRILAFVLDLISTFAGFGYLIGSFTGGLTEGGFQLNGAPAILLFALIVGYFVLSRYAGGSVWQRILRVG